MKSILSGSISFGLVNIPIKLYSAVQHHAVNFKLVHKKDSSPIKYKRYCEKENKEVEWKDIAKGIEISKGKFIVLSKEEIQKFKPAKSDLIEVIKFIDAKHLDPIYFNNHYFMAPRKEKDKAYFLFREVLQSTSKIAIARFVMREKEYVCVISSYKNGLLLSTLNYAYEIKDIKQIEELKNPPKLRKEELVLAKELINKLYFSEFDISEFKDTFLEQLKASIKQKEEGKVIIIKPKVKTKNLVEALKASLK
jgi:DNA end-binding protein Ku